MAKNMKSSRITLINCDEKLLKVVLDGEKQLSNALDVSIPDKWGEFGKEVLEHILDKVKEQPTNAKWYFYLPIETDTKSLLGSCGYKGAPDENGMVEIGYEVAEEYRNQGFATEITESLTKLAFSDNNVKKIQAHTAAHKNASVRVLEKCNFKFIEESFDLEDGFTWKWVKERDW